MLSKKQFIKDLKIDLLKLVTNSKKVKGGTEDDFTGVLPEAM